MFSQNIMMYVGVLCFSVNAGLFTFPMMSLISYWLLIDDVIAVGGVYSPIFSLAQLSWAQFIAYRRKPLFKFSPYFENLIMLYNFT